MKMLRWAVPGSALALFGLFVLSACQQRVTYPALGDNEITTDETAGIVWRDLVTRDPDAAQRFYGRVFGWTFESLADGAYTVIRRDGEAIGGIFPMPVTADPGSTAEWLVAMAVPDIANAVDVMESEGGQVVAAQQKLPGRGPTAVVADPQGAIFTLVSRGQVDTETPPTNDWLWTELWSNDLDASVSFYEDVTGLQAVEGQDGGRAYFYFQRDDTRLAGMIQNPMERTRTHWVPYVRVSDAAAAAAAIREAGGTVLAGPDPALRNGTVVAAMDPSGAHFVAQEWID